MSALAEVKISVVVTDSTGVVIERDLIPVRFAPGAGASGQHQTLSLASGNNTITIPSGAKALLLELTSSAPALTIKGASGDTGTTITPTSSVTGVALFLPLGTSPSLIINNAGSTYSADATFI